MSSLVKQRSIVPASLMRQSRRWRNLLSSDERDALIGCLGPMRREIDDALRGGRGYFISPLTERVWLRADQALRMAPVFLEPITAYYPVSVVTNEAFLTAMAEAIASRQPIALSGVVRLLLDPAQAASCSTVLLMIDCYSGAYAGNLAYGDQAIIQPHGTRYAPLAIHRVPIHVPGGGTVDCSIVRMRQLEWDDEPSVSFFEPDESRDAAGRWTEGGGGEQAATDTDEFRKWFGHSKVVSPDGKPLMVYHGTSHGGFTEFDPKKVSEGSLYGPGFYFTESQKLGESYEKKGTTWHLDRELTPKDMKAVYKYLSSAAIDRAVREDIGTREHYRSMYRAWQKGPAELAAFLASPDTGHDATLSKKLKIKGIEDKGNPELKSVYLRIEDPLDMDAPITERTAERLTKTILRHWRFDHHRQDWAPEDALQNAVHAGNTVDEALSGISNHIVLEDIDQPDGTQSMRVYNDHDAVELAKKAGYDGLTHIGGQIQPLDNTRHRVWIAFRPDQVRIVKNTPAPIEPAKFARDVSEEARDEHGQWTEGGGSGATVAAGRSLAEKIATAGFDFEIDRARSHADRLRKDFRAIRQAHPDMSFGDPLLQKKAAEANAAESAVESVRDQVRRRALTFLAVANPAPVRIVGSDLGYSAKEELDKAQAFISKVVASRPGMQTTVPFEHGKGPQYNGSKITAPQSVTAGQLVHEFGHFLEDAIAGTKEKETAFLRERTRGEEPAQLDKLRLTADRGAVGYKDDFAKVFGERSAYYAGRIYESGHRELLSMGLEMLYENAPLFATRDPDYFNFVIGILHNHA